MLLKSECVACRVRKNSSCGCKTFYSICQANTKRSMEISTKRIHKEKSRVFKEKEILLKKIGCKWDAHTIKPMTDHFHSWLFSISGRFRNAKLKQTEKDGEWKNMSLWTIPLDFLHVHVESIGTLDFTWYAETLVHAKRTQGAPGTFK